MGLYQKYRPPSLDAMYGNKEALSILELLLANKKKCPHSFLITGATGCGKTTIGRIIAKRLRAIGSDFKELDTADFRGIDDIRSIRKIMNYKPLEGKRRLWLLDECHKLTVDASNALLKMLEDPPDHVYFVLCTTEPQKLLPTIKGRCSIINVNPLSEEQMIKLLKSIAKEEGEKVDTEVLEQIAQDSLGHPRNAINILEQVLPISPEKRLKAARRSAEEQSQTIELCRALLAKNPRWMKVNTLLRGLKTIEPERIRYAVLGYCSAVLLKGDNIKAAIILEAFEEPFYNGGFPLLVLACHRVIKGE